jgi:hypothetical protein
MPLPEQLPPRTLMPVLERGGREVEALLDESDLPRFRFPAANNAALVAGQPRAEGQEETVQRG